MQNYKEQDGCWNCKFVFKRFERGEGEDYYCTSNASPRPPCMSRDMEDEEWPVKKSLALPILIKYILWMITKIGKQNKKRGKNGQKVVK